MTHYTRDEFRALIRQAKRDARFRIVLNWDLLIDQSCTTLTVTGLTRDGQMRSINVAI